MCLSVVSLTSWGPWHDGPSTIKQLSIWPFVRHDVGNRWDCLCLYMSDVRGDSAADFLADFRADSEAEFDAHSGADATTDSKPGWAESPRANRRDFHVVRTLFYFDKNALANMLCRNTPAMVSATPTLTAQPSDPHQHACQPRRTFRCRLRHAAGPSATRWAAPRVVSELLNLGLFSNLAVRRRPETILPTKSRVGNTHTQNPATHALTVQP